MSEPEFSFTTGAAPVVELGLGDTRVPVGDGIWDLGEWDAALWAGVEPSWRDVSCYAVEAELARGRERATDRFVPGTAGIVLNNEDGWADMAGAPLEVAAVALRPGRAIRIGVDVFSIGRVWLFRGIIDRVTPTYDPTHPDNVKLDCVDMLGEVGHVKLLDSPAVGGDDTVPQRLHRILDACRHPAEKRIIETAPAYLDPARGIASTPDIAVPDSFHFLARVRKTTVPSGANAYVAAQSAASQIGWWWGVAAAGSNELGFSTTGVTVTGGKAVSGAPTAGVDDWFGFLLDRPGGATHTYSGLASSDGVTWTDVGGGGTIASVFTMFDSNAPITIGALANGTTAQWDGRIYWAEMRTGIVAGEGDIVWRFDASEYPGGGATTYTDPRGATWTIGAYATGSDDVRVIQTTYGQQAVDELGLAADSAGGIVFGDGDGNIVYRDFGWQDYAYDTPADRALGNIAPGVPGVPAYTPEPYLIDTGAPVTLPDSGTLTLPPGFTIFATVRHPTGGTGTSFLAGQWGTGGQLEWKIERDRATGRWSLVTSADGTASTVEGFTTIDTPPTGVDETWALSVLFDNGAGSTVLQAFRRGGGDELNPLWFAASAPRLATAMPWANRAAPISIGTATGVSGQTWPGRIYDVELADASTVTPPGATVWRFDVSDTVAATSSWTDPRGRVWTVGGASSGHVHPAEIPAVEAVAGDICPAGWEIAYDRMDLATQVELNRQLPQPVPRLRWNLEGTVGGIPSSGAMRMDNGDQTLATVLSFSVADADATNAEPFLRNLVAGVEMRISDVGDATNNTRTYVAAGTPTRITAATPYYTVPVAWTEGATGVGGLVELQAGFLAPTAYVVDDEAGQSFYGVEVFSLTDLISIDGALFPELAERVLATRGYGAMPRLEAVTLDAKASRGEIATMETMVQCLPELPSRYACRLRHEDGRMLFDRNMFAVGTRHHISRDNWTLRIALDDADWAASPHGELDVLETIDVAAITGTVS